MLFFPNCKINIGLHIVSKREDGFHNIETIFAPVSWTDALEFVPSSVESYQEYGLSIPGDIENNLVLKAYHLLKSYYPAIPSLNICLFKQIPFGAGLGGGSADAAFMLRSMNSYFNLGLNESQLMQKALKLGSDCPFFIKNKLCFASGRGEQLEEIDLDISAYKLLLIKEDIHCSTAMAFAGINPRHSNLSLKESIKQPIDTWKDTIRNDFELSIFKRFSQLAPLKSFLYSLGALYASMSGSGSTLYGIFPYNLEIDLEYVQKKYPSAIIKYCNFL